MFKTEEARNDFEWLCALSPLVTNGEKGFGYLPIVWQQVADYLLDGGTFLPAEPPAVKRYRLDDYTHLVPDDNGDILQYSELPAGLQEEIDSWK